MSMFISASYKKGFKRGYNNPGQFDQSKLLKFNDDLSRGIIDGICKRKADDIAGTAEFK